MAGTNEGTGSIFGPVAEESFTTRLYIDYQSQGMEIPRNMIRMESGPGDSFQFDILGSIMVQSAPAGGGFPSAQNISLRARRVFPNAYTSYEPIDDDQARRISMDTIPDRATAHAWAHKRNEEQKIIDAAYSDAGYKIPADVKAAFTDNTIIQGWTEQESDQFSINKVFLAMTQLNANNVGGEKAILLDHFMLQDFMLDPKMSNRDTSPVYTLAQGMVPMWLGFKFFPISERQEGGMPVNGTTHTAISFNGNALAMFVRGYLQARIERQMGGRYGTDISTFHSFGVGIIQKEGIVHIEATPAVSRNTAFPFATA